MLVEGPDHVNREFARKTRYQPRFTTPFHTLPEHLLSI